MEELLTTRLFVISDVTITVGTLLVLALAVALSALAGWLLSRFTRRALVARNLAEELVAPICRLVRYAVLIIGAGAGLESAGVNLRGGFAAVSLFVRQYLDSHLFTVSNTPVTVVTLLLFCAVILLTFVTSRILEGAAEKAFRLRGVTDEGTIGTARRLIHYLILVIGLGVGVQLIGIDLSALFAAGALFAVGIGFAMQNLTQNFISGVILLLERTIRPGDVLRVDDRLIRVTAMRIRATVGRTLDDEDIIIPNSVLVQSPVTNYTMLDRHYRLRSDVGVVYSSDLKKVREVLESTTEELPWRVKTRKPRILLRQFGASSVDYEVSVWIDTPWKAQLRRSDLNESIWWALKEAGITIAFPQMDVHFDPPITESLTRSISGQERS